MTRIYANSLAAILLLATAPSFADTAAAKSPTGATAMSLYDLTANRLDGKPEKLADYKGKVVLVVNTASECGFTPQYKGLEELFEQYKDKGFVILGFPSNDFGGQEPGTSEEIKTFCERKYAVKFPMFEKVKTKGEGKSAVYTFLTTKEAEPKWNFHKYLVGKDGLVVTSFPSKVTPESGELRTAIDGALAK